MMKKSPVKKPKEESEQVPVGSYSNLTSSFRDPSGVVFASKGDIYRQINLSYKSNYEVLLDSGLYKELTSQELLISHIETNLSHHKLSKEFFKIIKPKKIPFISYPYEWSFSMLKDAALLTLKIQKIALSYGMSLKDASAFNIQFLRGKPILIDTLSFEKYSEGKPWVAYKQFIEHFLGPLCLMALKDRRLNRLSSIYLDGIPVDLVAKLLPLRSRLNPSLLIHIFAHASSQKKYSNKMLSERLKSRKFGKKSFLGLIDNLESVTRGLKWESFKTQWGDYYDEDKNNYNSKSIAHKSDLTKKFLNQINPKITWDIGANTGFFSRIASKRGLVISFDSDYGAIERNYLEVIKTREENILPLFADLTNPTPSLGWGNDERESLLNRGPADAILALALVHHLAISQNVPFDYIAKLFSRLGDYLIIEFVPKDDSQVQILLANREDVFLEYTKEHFEAVFSRYFKIKYSFPIKASKRQLYLMEKK